MFTCSVGDASFFGKPHNSRPPASAVIVEIHRERIAARLAVVFDGNHLTAFGVVTEAGRIGHADEFVMHERLGDLQRLGDDFAETVRIGAIRDDQELTIDETVRASGRRGWSTASQTLGFMRIRTPCC